MRGRTLDRILYGPDGKFLFKNRKLGVCALGKEKDYTYDVGALGLSFRFCRKCINKVGAVNLRHDSNIALHSTKMQTMELKQQVKKMLSKYQERFGVPMMFGVAKEKTE